MYHRALASIPIVAALTSGALADTVIPSRHAITTMMTAQPSLIGSLVMGAEGFNGWRPPAAQLPDLWKTTYLAQCQSNTILSRTTNTLDWPSMCDPAGMTRTVNQLTGQHWVTTTFEQFDGNSAEAAIINGMLRWGTPTVIPLYGLWDHWAAIQQIGTMTVGTTDHIRSVSFYDALPTGMGGMGFVNVMGIRDFLHTYMDILAAPGAPCNPGATCSSTPYNDPWYYRWVIIQEPPVGATLVSSTPAPSLPHWIAPALVKVGEMNARVAMQRAFESVRLAAMDADPLVQKVLSSGAPESAVLVNGLLPSQQPWDYYLVTVRDRAAQTTAFIQLAADDGSVANIAIPNTPFAYQPLEMQQAAALASKLLKSDETIATERLAWDAAYTNSSVRAPYWPYYEFSVVDKAGHERGVVRVPRHDGKLSERIDVRAAQ